MIAILIVKITGLDPVDKDAVMGSCGVGKCEAERVEKQQQRDGKIKVTAEIVERRLVGKR